MESFEPRFLCSLAQSLMNISQHRPTAMQTCAKHPAVESLAMQLLSQLKHAESEPLENNHVRFLLRLTDLLWPCEYPSGGMLRSIRWFRYSCSAETDLIFTLKNLFLRWFEVTFSINPHLAQEPSAWAFRCLKTRTSFWPCTFKKSRLKKGRGHYSPVYATISDFRLACTSFRLYSYGFCAYLGFRLLAWGDARCWPQVGPGALESTGPFLPLLQNDWKSFGNLPLEPSADCLQHSGNLCFETQIVPIWATTRNPSIRSQQPFNWERTHSLSEYRFQLTVVEGSNTLVHFFLKGTMAPRCRNFDWEKTIFP